ncbi:membrane protein [Mycobacterium phage Leopard]|uniref:Uncharacterized protein n=1 Tax=Mycobacterium phage Onyinye TaxID=2686235 RepID=A0A6B9LHY7_9CAUD|nr:hypothetical protein PP339_gp048 [Mycobacterium phage Onyinye]QHB37454.1 hypothetical protein SEA_ONYINYE_48 [Mycobacterium phage Onyinye]UOW92925.1 membrane protein [Mycobacterium phage Leopard]WKW85209.1 hypothetical protein SEA_AIKOY__47 [Mycobacterium phage Aikoy]
MSANPYRKLDPELPIKQRVEVVTAESPSGATPVDVPAAEVVVVDQKQGTVTFTDKMKAYYHTIITIIGAILVLLNEVTPITDGLPDSWQRGLSVVIVFLTGVANALKSNEKWINAL